MVLASSAAVAGPPMRGWKISIRLVSTIGNTASRPVTDGPTLVLVPTTMATRHATIAARSGMSYQRRDDARHRHVAVAHHQRDADREDRDVEGNDGDDRPIDGRQREGKREPDGQRGGEADGQRLALRQHDVDQREDAGHRVGGQAAERAARDERRVVVEREEHIGRRRRDRQRRDHRADRRAGALGHHRGGDHEAGGDGHLQGEREPECEVGGHSDPN